MGNEKKVAIVHDFLLAFGGAERVLQSLAKIYPEAPIYTILADKKLVTEILPGRDVRTSFVQRLPGWLRKHHRFLLPLYPAAVESLDLREFDLVLTSSGAWSKGIVTRLRTKHIAYVHSPMRYVWDENERYLQSLKLPFGFRIFGRMLLSYLRVWDRQASERPDVMIANSRYTADRIQKYYRRDSQVVYPAVSKGSEEDLFHRKDFFLLVGRLTEAKKIDVAIESFNKLELPLMIVGIGPQERYLRRISGKTITFLGWQDNERLQILYREARALVHVAEEDFGLSLAEALSFGTPVIAYGHGGAREIVQEGKTGELFFSQTPEILSDGIRRFLKHEGSYDRDEMKKKAVQFSEDQFFREIKKIVSE